jgi:hypothetical protein
MNGQRISYRCLMPTVPMSSSCPVRRCPAPHSLAVRHSRIAQHTICITLHIQIDEVVLASINKENTGTSDTCIRVASTGRSHSVRKCRSNRVRS